jgi:hypothetical protein
MFSTVFGVDFSAAKLAGPNIWVARLEARAKKACTRYHVVNLANLEQLCGTAERGPALAYLVGQIASSRRALWALDFPFGLPVEVVEDGVRWSGQIDWLRGWGEDAYGLGLECLRRAKALGGRRHIRRLTDVEARAPFDCYHYRVIYQTVQNVERPGWGGFSRRP